MVGRRSANGMHSERQVGSSAPWANYPQVRFVYLRFSTDDIRPLRSSSVNFGLATTAPTVRVPTIILAGINGSVVPVDIRGFEKLRKTCVCPRTRLRRG